MNDFVLECRDLEKFYKRKPILDAVSFSCKSAHIYGLIGNKGAGKTTLMQILTGLSFPDQGEFSLFGIPSDSSRLRIEQRRVGALVGSPIFFDFMSGFSNLEYFRRLKGVEDRSVSERLISLFGLEDKKKIAVRHYTIAMKQKLAIACALLNHPDFLLLDEPFNGLEPDDILELCGILGEINRKQNTAMLIATPYAEQLYKFATDYLFMDQGKILEEISHSALTDKCHFYLTIETEQPESTVTALHEFLPNAEIELLPDTGEIRIHEYMGRSERISSELQFRNLPVLKIEQVGTSVKDYLTQLTGGSRYV